MLPTHREPTHPGEMLLEEFLVPMGITQKELSRGIHVPYQKINEIINKRRAITPGIALRLAKFFGVTEDFWMNLQLRWNLYKAKRTELKELNTIKPFQLKEFTAILKATWNACPACKKSWKYSRLGFKPRLPEDLTSTKNQGSSFRVTRKSTSLLALSLKKQSP